MGKMVQMGEMVQTESKAESEIQDKKAVEENKVSHEDQVTLGDWLLLFYLTGNHDEVSKKVVKIVRFQRRHWPDWHTRLFRSKRRKRSKWEPRNERYKDS